MAKSLTAPKPPQIDQPSPASLPELQRKVIDAQVQVGRLKREGSGGAELLLARIMVLVSRANTLRLVRVFQLYVQRRGPLMAAGLAYRLFFAIVALLVVVFAALGLILAGNEELRTTIIDTIDAGVPGLIEIGGDEGLATPEQLFNATEGLGLTLAISAGVMLFTSLAWVGGMRQAMRGIFALGAVRANPLFLRVKDLGTLSLLAVVMLLTTALGIIATNSLDALLVLLELSEASRVMTQTAGFLLMLTLDTLVAMVLLHSASAIDMPRPVLLQGGVIAGIGSTILRTFSAQLLAGVRGNPILVPFAVILALFIWFFFLSQVYLLATAWCAVGTADAEWRAERRHHAKAGTLHQRSLRRNRT